MRVTYFGLQAGSVPVVKVMLILSRSCVLNDAFLASLYQSYGVFWYYRTHTDAELAVITAARNLDISFLGLTAGLHRAFPGHGIACSAVAITVLPYCVFSDFGYELVHWLNERCTVQLFVAEVQLLRNQGIRLIVLD